jgi:hypothetical protein
MTPAAAIAALDRQIAAHGEAVTLRRVGTPSDTTVTARAFVRRAAVDPLVPGGDPAQASTMLVLSPTGLTTFVPPARGDKVEITGRATTAIEEVEVVRIGATVVRYNLRVLG